MCVCVRVCVCVYACVSARAGILHARAAAAAVPGGGERSALTRSRLEGDVKERRLRVIKPLRNVARTRNQAAKVFMSSEHAKLSTPGFSPGPSAYTLRAAVGSQADGRKSSAPRSVARAATAAQCRRSADSSARSSLAAYRAYRH